MTPISDLMVSYGEGASVKVKKAVAAATLATLLACGGGGTSGTPVSPSPAPGGDAGTTTPILQTIVVTPADPGVVAGSSVQLTATGAYSDGSTRDITSSAAWTSADTSVATVGSSGLVRAKASGTTKVAATSGGITDIVTLTVRPLSLTRVKKVTLTGSGEGGSARPEVVATSDRVFVLYLGHIGGMSRTFDVKVYDRDMTTQIAAKTIVSSTASFGSPTDIRVAADGGYLYAFYETSAPLSPFLHGAKYALNDAFDLIASASSPITTGRPLPTLAEGDEIINDPAPLVGPVSVFVITRIWSTIASAGKTVYRVREFSKDTMAQVRQFDLDLSSVADGRGRVTSLLYSTGSIYMALATTVSDQGAGDANKSSDDGAQCDIILLRMNPDWTFDASKDVRVISAEPDDRENYITGLRTDGTYFYMTYKQATGLPPTGEQRAVIKIFDMDLNLLLKEIVTSVAWGGAGGEIRPSLEVRGNRVFSGQSGAQQVGTGDASVYLYEK